MDTQAACPFRNSSICRTNSSNIRLDTGYMNLNNDFGVNAPPDNNILFRAVLQCAPLETQGYTKPVEGLRDNFTTYNYGASFQANYTYMVESLDGQYNKEAENMDRGSGANFILNGLSSNVDHHEDWEDNEDFSSIPGLFNPDGDTILIFLSSNGIQFFDMTSDPWYRATIPGDTVHGQQLDEGLVVYQPEEAASPMGCVKQFQFCNPSQSSNNCGPLASWADAQNYAAPLFGITTEDFDNAIDPPTSNVLGSRFVWLGRVLAWGQASIAGIISNLGPEALTSIKYLSTGVMGPLPVDQWQLDVRYWWATFLASLQAAVKIRSTKHVSFSLFGLYFTLVTGVLIIIISYVLEPIFECLYRRRKYREYTFLEWTTSETLQLQRIGFQGVGSGTWTGYTDNIPRTKQDEALTGLALEYPLETDGSDGGRGSPEKTLGSMLGPRGTASQDEETDVASLDDLLDSSGSQNGSENGSEPASRWPSVSGVMIELHGNSCGSESEPTRGGQVTPRESAAGDVFRPDT
ncbi:hypothetical protein SLS63_003215 [Diaporthe eres]|uniref:Uncharacterized protein n=1 Tax=Diaporthe eres TaxID=83184 RepID=A0ABR1PHF7_DIAER